MFKKKGKTERVDKDGVVIKTDPELTKRKYAKLSKIDTQPTALTNFTLEEMAFILVFMLMVSAAFLAPQRILNDYQVPILLFVVTPYLGWFVRLIYLDIKRYGK